MLEEFWEYFWKGVLVSSCRILRRNGRRGVDWGGCGENMGVVW